MIYFFISLTTYFCYLIIKYQKHLCLINKDKFNLSKYNQDVMKNATHNFLTPEILGLIIVIIAVNTDAKMAGISMVVFYTLLFLYELKGYKKEIKLTKDIIRTIIFIAIIYLILFACFIIDYVSIQNDFLLYDHRWIYYTLVIIAGYLSPFITLLAGLLNNLWLKFFKKSPKKKAKTKK